METVRLREQMKERPWFNTGEGRTDFQTLFGRPHGSGERSQTLGIPVVIISGGCRRCPRSIRPRIAR